MDRLDCDEITQVTWRRRGRRLKEFMRGGNNFVFNAFLYLEPVQQFVIWSGLEDLGAATTA